VSRMAGGLQSNYELLSGPRRPDLSQPRVLPRAFPWRFSRPGVRIPALKIGEVWSRIAAGELTMHDLSAVVARVEKLERENRRLKVIGGTVVAVLAAVALVGVSVRRTPTRWHDEGVASLNNSLF